MNLSLPETKVSCLLELVSNLESVGSASRKELERLGGLVAHCTTVIKGGRTFSRRIYDLCMSCPRRGRVKLGQEILADLSWWKSLCAVFNSSGNIIPRSPGLVITTDSSFFGFGAWCERDWVWGTLGDHVDGVLHVDAHREPLPLLIT